MPAVKNVGEPCAGEPHARFDVAAGGNQASRLRRAVPAPPADPTAPAPPSAGEQGFRPITYGAVDAGEAASLASGEERGPSDPSRETSRPTKAGPVASSRCTRLLIHAAERKRVFRADHHDDRRSTRRRSRGWRAGGPRSRRRYWPGPTSLGSGTTGRLWCRGKTPTPSSVGLTGVQIRRVRWPTAQSESVAVGCGCVKCC